MADTSPNDPGTERRLNVYRDWLGIPPQEQPPHHYRLLGLEPFESDRAVIVEAADERIRRVRPYTEGPHKETAQKLLNVILAARMTLVDAEKKAAYDQRLRKKLRSSAESPAVESPGAPAESFPSNVSPTRSPRRRRKDRSLVIAVGTATVLAAATAFGVFRTLGNSDNETTAEGTAADRSTRSEQLASADTSPAGEDPTDRQESPSPDTEAADKEPAADAPSPPVHRSG